MSETVESSKALLDAKNSLSRVQGFKADALERKGELGVAFEFSRAVAPANKLIALFQRLPSESLDFFPDNELSKIKQASDSVFALFEQVSNFDPAQADATTRREAIIQSLTDQYQSSFSAIYPFISFSIARTANFPELASEGRAAVQAIRDEVEQLVEDLMSSKKNSEEILDEIRKTAAERGVSQEAYHFSTQAAEHKVEAERWQKYTVRTAIALGIYAVSTLFVHEIPFLSPADVREATQLIVSKFLIFAVMAFMLGLCAKNFLAHKHNQIVNTHRQNSLMTYKSLVDAGASPESRDIVLQHAASSIYRLHDTGYIKVNGESSGANIVEIFPRPSVPINTIQGN